MLSTRLLTTLKAVAVIALLLSSSLGMAQTMTPAQYVSMDLQARQLTIDGVRERLTLLQRHADIDTQLASDANTQQRVEAVYQHYGTTSSSAIAWATQHADSVAEWLTDNPDQQAEYNRMDSALNALSRQIQALANQ